MAAVKIKKQNVLLPVSAASIDFLKKVSDTALRLLIFLSANENRAFTPLEIASAFSISETTVNAALAELSGYGFFDEDVKHEGNLPKAEEPVKIKAEPESAAILSSDENIEKYSSAVINNAISANKDLRILFKKAEKVLGHILSGHEMVELYGIYDNLKLPPAVISMLLTYCEHIKKTHMKQIEKTALFWRENNICTVDSAEKYITYIVSSEKDENEILRLYGIKDRLLTKNERELLSVWRGEWHFSYELIAYAGELCIMRTGKISFPYINKILSSWHENNIKTIAEAKTDGERKQSLKKAPQKTAQSYDIDEYRRISMERLNKKNQ